MKHECQDCGKKWDEAQLREVKHLLERVAPGEPMPSGECPECGAVCHPEPGGHMYPVKLLGDEIRWMDAGTCAHGQDLQEPCPDCARLSKSARAMMAPVVSRENDDGRRPT
jgi:hypothetical protein